MDRCFIQAREECAYQLACGDAEAVAVDAVHLGRVLDRDEEPVARRGPVQAEERAVDPHHAVARMARAGERLPHGI